MKAENDGMTLPLRGALLEANLSYHGFEQGLVVFAHGSGSSRHSPRNRYVARHFQDSGFATLLIDLLTPEEEEIDMMTRHLRFDINLLADRLTQITDWVRQNSSIHALPIGLFGSSTGAGAALVAAAHRPNDIQAVVSRGGRPDLAYESLSQVKAPTLLIVGERDYAVINMNQNALRQMECEKKLEIVPNATHLFEEPGALDEVAKRASRWFQTHLSRVPVNQ